MLRNYDSDSNIDHRTGIEIYAAICYLAPGPTNADERHVDDQDDQDKYNVVVISVLLVCSSFFWFYLQ